MAVTIKRVKTKNSFDASKYISNMRKRAAFMINRMGGIVISDITVSGIDKGRDIDGRQFQPLKAATIKAKIKKGSATPRTALKDTGLMRHVYLKKKATQSNINAEIAIAQKRNKIAGYHHEGGNKGNNPPQRKWFGISLMAEQRMNKFYIHEMKQGIGRNG